MQIGFPEVTPEFKEFIQMMNKRRRDWRFTFFIGISVAVLTTSSAVFLWYTALTNHKILSCAFAVLQTIWTPVLCFVLNKARQQWVAAAQIYKHGTAVMKCTTLPQVLCQADQINAAIEHYNKL